MTDPDGPSRGKAFESQDATTEKALSLIATSLTLAADGTWRRSSPDDLNGCAGT